jgi:hypothetical protein
MAAMSGSPELRTLRECTSQLETALRGLESGLVHFLNREGFFSDEVQEKILNPVSTFTVEQKARELVSWIKHRVGQHPPSYHVLLGTLKEGGKHYEPIVGILEAEYLKQTSKHAVFMSTQHTVGSIQIPCRS